jgi:phosphoribosyl-dephospho-CoA transferase
MKAMSAVKRPWRRHELVRIAPEAWAAVTAAVPVAPSLLLGWASAGWPAIVRRPTPGEPPDMVPIGVPLPPAEGKKRFCLTVPAIAITQRFSPPSLRTVAVVADRAWEPTISALIALGERNGVTPAAFGSLLWQYHTGLPYLSRQSDVDVLWPVQAGCQIRSLLAGIAAIERIAPMRIDGEVVFPDWRAVNRRELYNVLNQDKPAEVLVKSMGGVRLLDASRLPGSRQAA